MNETYKQALIDVLSFINSVEDGDLDFIIWKLERYINEEIPLFNDEEE